MPIQTTIQYVSDEAGQAVAVIVPIDLWREMESEKETAYLLKSDTMRRPNPSTPTIPRSRKRL